MPLPNVFAMPLPLIGQPMANPGRTLPIKQVIAYGGSVTEPTPEPTLADVMEYLREFSGHVMAEFSKVNDRFNQTDAAIAGAEDRLRGEIQATEADLASRIGAVQDVLRTLKADLAAHVNDPEAHHRHAA